MTTTSAVSTVASLRGFAALAWCLVGLCVTAKPALAQIDSPHLIEVVQLPDRVDVAKAQQQVGAVDARGNVIVVDFDGDYDRFLSDSSSNVLARQQVAEQVLRSGQGELDNRFDFLVIFTEFPVDLGPNTTGVNWSVSNAVEGIGRPIFHSSGSFGSRRLLSIIDMRNALVEPVAPGSFQEDQVLDTLMHELMHQWGSHLRLDLPGLPADVLLGSGGVHWSALLSTDASVMYGARWQLLPDMRARSIGVREQYAPLDLYAAGWLGAEELPPITLLESSDLASSALPEIGVEITATARTLGAADIVAANGARVPDQNGSQKHFKAALVLLKRSGAPASEAVLDRIEAFRLRAQDRFSALTLGRAHLELGYEAPSATAQAPPERMLSGQCGEVGQPDCATGTEGAVQWLLTTQRADGSWADKPQTAVRDTLLAIAALQAAMPDGHASIDQAIAWLATVTPADVEQKAALLQSGLIGLAEESALVADLRQTRTPFGSEASFGAQGSRRASTLETAQVLGASVSLQARGREPVAPIDELLEAVVNLRQANPAANPPSDAQFCWARESRGGCDGLSTLAALRAIAAVGVTAGQLDDTRGILLSLEVDPDGAQLAERLHVMQALGLADDARVQALDGSLRAAQRVDGSWAGSVSATAESLRWLIARNLPDLQPAGPIEVDAPSSVVGLPLRLHGQVRNAGSIEASSTRLVLEFRHEDSLETDPWLPLGDAFLPAMAPGVLSTYSMDWQTLGLVPGSYRVRLRLDVDGELAEANELNNEREESFVLQAPPTAVDLLIASAQVSPDVLNTVPLPVLVQAEVINIGLDAAAPSTARLYAWRFGQLIPMAEQSIQLPSQGRLNLELTGTIDDPDVTALVLKLDDDQALIEADEGNNEIQLQLLSQPAVDLEVRSQDLSVSPEAVEQGQALRLAVTAHNRGVRGSPVFRIRLSVQGQSAPARVLLEQDLQIGPGESALRHYDWTADLAGPVSLIVEMDPEDLVSEVREDNNRAQLDLAVLPSTLPNLTIVPGSLVLSPDPVLAGTETTLNVLVRNSSTAPSAPTDLTVYLDDPDLPASVPWGSSSIAALAGESSVDVTLVLPPLPGRGTRTLFARVDAQQLLAEANEGDNDELRQFELRALPDLELRSADLSSTPTQPAPGSNATLNVVVNNLGEQGAVGATVTVERWVDGVGVEASAPQLIPELAAGANVTLQFPFERASDSGSMVLRAFVDSAEVVAESDESNNVAELTIGDLDPNLYVTEEFISPNGDGIRDSTEIVARVPAPQDLRVRILSSWGEEVFRAEGGPLSNTTVASVHWNGLRQDGRRALDDRYSVRVERASGELLGLLAVTVDTNNSPLLQAFHTGHDRYASVGTTCDIDGRRRSPSPGDIFHPPSESLVSLWWEVEPGERALYRSPLNGQPATRIIKLNDLHVGALTSTQQWLVKGSNEIAVLLIAEDLTGLVYELHALRIDGRVSSRLVWSGTEHPGARHASLETDWAVFRASDGLAAIHMQTGERRLLSSTIPDQLLAQTEDALLYQINSPGGTRLMHQTLTETVFTDVAAHHLTVVSVGDGRFAIAAETTLDEIEPWYLDTIYVLDPSASQPLTMLPIPADADASLQLLGGSEAGELIILRSVPASVLRWNIAAGLVQETELPEVFVTQPESERELEPGERLRAGFRAVHASPGHDRWHFEALLLRHVVDHPYEYLDNDNFILDPTTLRLEVLPELGKRFDNYLHYPFWIVGETQAIGYESGVLIRRGFVQRATFPESVGQLDPIPLPESMLLQGGGDICENSGLRIVRSGANLGLDLELDFVSAYSGFLLRLTAEDQNLDHYRIDARRPGIPGAQAIHRGSTPRLDSAVAIWSPPQPGVYELTVQAWDKAGNHRQFTIPAFWFDHSLLGTVQLSEQFLSPNGDGRLDQLRLEYETYGPLNAQIEIRDAIGVVVQTHENTHTVAGNYSYQWSGTNAQGEIVADGEYELLINGRRLPFTVDTVPPALQVNQPREGLPPTEAVCDWESSDTSATMRRGFKNPVSAVDVSASEPHWKSVRFQARGHQLGEGWHDAEAVLTPSDTDVFLQWRFHSGDWAELDHRLLVEDLAGNQNAVELLAPLPFISAKTFTSDAVDSGRYQLGAIWQINYPLSRQDTPTSVGANTDLGEVLLEIVDPRVSPTTIGLIYRTNRGRSGTLELIPVPDSDATVSAPSQRCVVSGAKVYRASLPSLAPLEEIEYLLTGTGIPRDFDEAYQGERLWLEGQPTECLAPPGVGRCGFYGQSEVLVPLLWCPIGTEVAFGKESTASAGFIELANRLEAVDPVGLIPAGTGACPLAQSGPRSECPDGYACNCLLTSVDEFPIGDIWTAQRPIDRVWPEVHSQFYGRVGGDRLTVELDYPLSGDRVCAGGSLYGQVFSETDVPKVDGRIRYLGNEYPALTRSENPGSSRERSPLVAIYPMGVGLVPVRPYRFAPDVESDADLAFIDLRGGESIPVNGSPLLIPDGASIELDVWAENVCQGPGPVVTRELTVDLGVLADGVRMTVPTGIAPPFRYSALVPQRGFSIALSHEAEFSVVFGEPLTGTLTVQQLSTGETVRTLATGDFPPGVLSRTWQGTDESGNAVADGLYYFVLDLTDSCGSTFNRTYLFYVDSTPPSVSMASPTPSQIAGPLVSVLVSPTDYRHVSTEIQLRRLDPVHGPGAWVPQALLTEHFQGTYSWIWQAGRYSPGTYELRARAADEVGNIGQWEVVEVIIPERPDLIAYASIIPELISPNGDGVLDVAVLDLLLNQPVPLAIDVVDADRTPVALLEPEFISPGTFRASWDGTNDDGAVVPDGEYYARILAGEEGASSGLQEMLLQIVVDNTPPGIEPQIADGAFVSPSDELIVEFTDAHPLRWEISSSSSLPHLIPEGERFGEQAVLAWSGVEEGEHELRIRALDDVGNSTTETLTFTLDQTPPIALITYPGDGDLVTRGSSGIEVVGFATDLHPASWALEVVGLDGVAHPVASGNGNIDGPLGQWPAAGSDGNYALRLRVVDLAGNESEHQVQVVLDNTPPVVTISGPLDGSWLGSSFAVNGSVADPHLQAYQLEIAPRSAGTLDWQRLSGGTTELAGLLANVLAPSPDGPYVLRLSAVDRVGLTGEAYVDVDIDTEPPLPPPVLNAEREGLRDVRLSWNASSSPDVVAYRLFRDGQLLLELPGLSHLDQSLSDGERGYQVTALDRAGNESSPSNEARIRIDTTPPDVSIHAPQQQSRVRAEVAIRGRAHSQEDFDRYRLSLTPAAAPSVTTVLVQGGNPNLGGELAVWDSRAHPDGDYGLLLEAWDFSQNRAETSVVFTVDNTPPAAPEGVNVSVDDTAVDLSWQANSEPDLAGYLVYLGPELLNGSANADPRSIVYTETSHRVEALGDGSHDFRVMAVDTTGNVSDPSSPATAEVAGHPPRVTLVRPSPGTVFEQPILVRGSTTDQDLTEVRLQYRVQGTGSWTDMGAPFTQPPFERSFLPADQAYGDYELRAASTDSEGLTDPSPPVVAVEYRDLTAPDEPVSLAAAVDGDQVSLSWNGPQALDVSRYRIERQLQSQGAWQTVGEVAQPSLTFVDQGVADGLYQYRVRAIDAFDNISEGSESASARVWSPALVQPYAPGNQSALLLRARSTVAGEVELERVSSLGADPVVVPALAADAEAQLPVVLLRGLNEFRLRVVDAAGNRSRSASVLAAYDADPATPAGLQLTVNDHDVSLQWDPNPEDSIRGYRLFRRGAAVLSDELIQPSMAWVYATGQTPFELADLVDGDPDTGAYFFPRNNRDEYLEVALPAESLIVTLYLDGVQDWSASERVRLEGLWEGRWIELPAVTAIESDGRIVVRPDQPYVSTRLRLAFRAEGDSGGSFHVGEVAVLSRPLLAMTKFAETLSDGAYLYRVSAVNQYGFEGPRSDAVEAQVGDAQAPDPVVLSSDQTDADVSLSWSESSAPDLAAYQLYRRGQLLVEITDLNQRSFLDAALPNGIYDYQVFAVDAVGNAAGSNVVVHTISGMVPAEPTNLAVSPIEGGGALRLQWSPGLGAPATEYRVSRALQGAGPFQPIVQVPAAQTTYVDNGLQNGVRYYYVVAALDGRGNASGDSNVADGVPFANERLITPVFTYPTRFGQSVTLPGPETVVAGSAEPDSRLLLGYRDQLWPELELPAETEIHGVGYGGQRSAINAAANWIWNDYGYTAVLQALNADGGGDENDLGQACAQAQWLTSNTLLHCDGQTLPERLLRLDVASLDQSELVLSQSGIRGFRQSTDGHAWLLLANFDWPDGSRDSFALRRDGGPWQELAVHAFDVDPDSLQMDPSSRWALLRRMSDERLLRVDLASGMVDEIDAAIAAATPVGFHPDQAMAVLAGVGPVGQGLYRLDLTNGDLHWLDVGGGFAQGAAFSPFGDQVHVLIDGQWQLYQWPGMTFVQSADANGAVRMQALATGEVLLSSSESYGELSWLRPAGVFRVDGVPLAPGENLLTALSIRVGQLNSQPALPITVLVPADGLPDLEVRASDLSLLPNQVHPGDQPRLGARVRNIGSGASEAISASLVLSTPAGTLSLPPRSVAALLPGDETLISWILPSLDQTGPHVAQVRLDPDGTLTERSTANNQASLTFAVSADGAPDLVLLAQPSLLAPTQAMTGQVSVLTGGQALAGRLTVRIVSPAGQLVRDLLDEAVQVPAVGNGPERDLLWIPGNIAAGDYQVQASLYDTQGQLRARQTVPVAVSVVRTLSLTSVAQPASVPVGNPITLSSELRYLAGNAPIEQASLRVRLETFEGDVLAESDQPLATLSPGYQGVLTTVLNPDPVAPAGQYVLRAELWTQSLLAESAAALQLTDAMALAQLDGALQLPAAAIPIGEGVSIPLVVRNVGTLPLTGLPVRASLRRSLQSAPSATLEQVIDLPVGGEWSAQLDVPPALLGLGDQLVSLIVIDGPHAGVLDFGGFAVVDRTPPQLSLIAPNSGSVVPARFRVDARAVDLHHPLGEVRIQSQGQAWQPMSAGIDFAGQYVRAFGPLGDGPLSLRLDASDSVGNRTEIGPFDLIVDATPPLVQITGVADGGLYNSPRTPLITITEAHPQSSQQLLDGQPFTSGELVATEGLHVLYVLARDVAGNEGSAIVSFTMDFTPPEVSFASPSDGAVIAASQTLVRISTEPAATVTLIHAGGTLQAVADAQGVAMFDTVPLVDGANVLAASARDLAGNQSAPVEIGVIRSAATINAVTGDLQVVSPVEPPTAIGGQWQLQNLSTLDLAPLPVRLTLRRPDGTLLEQAQFDVSLLADGSAQDAFSFATQGLELGLYGLTLSAQLVDEQSQLVWVELAQTTVELADLTAPSLQWLSPQANALVGADPELRVAVTDALSGVDRVELTLDAVELGPQAQDPLVPSQFVSQPGPLTDGPHLARFLALDHAGNPTSSEREFVVDATPPAIQISGVSDEQLSNQPLAPVVVITDPHLASSEILLDGLPFASGSTVAGEGVHTLQVEAADALGNSASRTLSFTLDFTPPALSFLTPPDGLQTLAAHVPAQLQSEAAALVELVTGANSQNASTGTDGLVQFAAVPLQLGPNSLQASAIDAAGNRSAVVAVEVTRVRPTQAIIEGFLTLQSATVNHGSALLGGYQIGNGGNFDPGPITILVRVYDGSSLLEERSWPMQLPPDATTEQAFSIDSSSWSLGELRVELSWRAEDEPDASPVIIDQRLVTIRDGDAPEVSIVEPIDGAIVGSKPLIRATATDVLSEIAVVAVRINAGAWQPMTASVVPDSYEASPFLPIVGYNLVEVRAADTAQNEAFATPIILCRSSSLGEPGDGLFTDPFEGIDELFADSFEGVECDPPPLLRQMLRWTGPAGVERLEGDR